MSSGTLTPIKNLYSGLFDGPHATPKPATSGPVFLGIKNITDDGHFNFSDIRHISYEEYPRWIKRVKPTAGDVVFTYEATLNRYAIIQDGFEGCLGRRMALIRPDESKAHNKYLYYYFFSPEWRATIKKNMLNGSTVDRIPLTRFPDFPVRTYTIATQKKIAGVLGAYDDLIENNSNRIEKLEAMARLLYKHYFEVPESTDWEEITLSEILTVRRGKSYKSSELAESNGLPFVNLKNIKEYGGFRKDGLKWFIGDYKDTQKVYKGDIVMAVTEMTYRRAIIARVGRVPSMPNEFGIISMDVIKLEPHDNTAKNWLYAMFRWSRFGDQVKEYANGVNVLHLLPARVEEYKINVPPKELTDAFAKKVSPLFELIDNLQQKNEQLSQGRDLLLPRLMSGEIEV